MLVKYNNSNKNIVMGLISFLPQISTPKLAVKMMDYFDHPDRAIYVYEKYDQYIGLVLLNIQDEYVVVMHLILLPEFNNIQNEHEILEDVSEIYYDKHLTASLAKAKMIERFELKKTREKL